MVRITGGERTSENAGKAKFTVMAQLPRSPGPEGLPQEGPCKVAPPHPEACGRSAFLYTARHALTFTKKPRPEPSYVYVAL
jgi:hypothetical protein